MEYNSREPSWIEQHKKTIHITKENHRSVQGYIAGLENVSWKKYRHCYLNLKEFGKKYISWPWRDKFMKLEEKSCALLQRKIFIDWYVWNCVQWTWRGLMRLFWNRFGGKQVVMLFCTEYSPHIICLWELCFVSILSKNHYIGPILENCILKKQPWITTNRGETNCHVLELGIP